MKVSSPSTGLVIPPVIFPDGDGATDRALTKLKSSLFAAVHHARFADGGKLLSPLPLLLKDRDRLNRPDFDEQSG
jgi:hypothetical protein